METSLATRATERAPFATIGRVLLPFGLGYFLSYLFRTVNAVIGPEVAAALDLNAADLGLLTSAYFLAFALFQIPLGVLLDRYGPRRVEPALLLVAATGALVFSLGESAATLAIGRSLIGLGASSCLMAAMKANVQWWPPDRLPLANGMILTMGGLGALVATAPTEALLHYTDWRGVFLLLAGATLVVAALIFFVVPNTPTRPASETWRSAAAGALRLFAHPAFLRLAPLTMATQASFLAYHGLWAAAWLRDIDGLDRTQASVALAIATMAIVVGNFAWAFLADRLARRGVSVLVVTLTGTVIYIAAQLALVFRVPIPPELAWSAFAFFGTSSTLYFSILPRVFPVQMSGRALTALNMVVFVAAFLLQWLIGVALARLGAGGWSAADAHSAVLGGLVVAECLGLAWLLLRRNGPLAPA